MKARGTILSLATLTCVGVAQAAKAGTFVVVGDSGVSAQMMFMKSEDKVYILDKTENNTLKINDHPAWGSEYSLSTNTPRAMEVLSNSFCAGGIVLGNGSWITAGGNQAVNAGGTTAANQSAASPDYQSYDGGKALRILECDETADTCEWGDYPSLYMTTRRWYPTLETLQDGTAIILGGCEYGGYVNWQNYLNNINQNNPTYEFWPSRGNPTSLNILLDSMPINLFPLTWLLPSGNLFIQSNWNASIFDWQNGIEYPVNNIPHAVRLYPASGATTALPMTPANNWTLTAIFCGGTDLDSDQWTPDTWNIAGYAADASCVTISPDVDLTWYDEDSLDTGRTMGQFINLPDGRLFLVNGASHGTAGYGTQSWAIGQSYGDGPLHQAWYFNSSQPSGSRWSKAGVGNVDRMYHSTATLLLDGSVMVAGSNPNADFMDATIAASTDPTRNYTYFTEYRVEIFYPDYYDQARPAPTGFPSSIPYGGSYTNMSLSLTDLAGDPMNILKTKAVLIRTGFSTHAFNMGQRHIELRTSFTVAEDGSAVLHVSALPPNPSILAPGQAALFIVVDGVPSKGQNVMIGNGEIGTQPTSPDAELPLNSMPEDPSWAR